MPAKGRKRTLSSKSSDAKRKKDLRLGESSQERSQRLEDQRTRQEQNRKNELEEDHSQRIQKQRMYETKKRASEANEVKVGRQNKDANAKMRKRQNEPEEERNKRLRKERLCKIEKAKMTRVTEDIDFFNENDAALKGIHHELPSLYDADNICPKCDAYRWKDERKGFCCEDGKIDLPHETDMPAELKELYEDKDFLHNIRSYNNALALASIGCNEEILPGFSPTFKIHGKVFHRIGSLQPSDGEEPKFAQIYFHDNEHETENRLKHNPHLKPEILEKLQVFLKHCNPYIKSLVCASEITKENPDLQLVIHADKKPDGEHQRRYNLPTASEVAVIMPGEQAGHLDIVIQTKDGQIQHINSMHRSYDPLHYILLFPYGEDGYTEKLLHKNKDSNRISPTEFHRYHLQVRAGSDNRIMKSRKLTQQYATDAFAKAEGQRMRWVNSHQKEIRAEKYKGLIDAVDAHDEINAGKKVILPPTITGTPRWYAEEFQDSMALVRKFGKPDFFVTHTTDPNCDEIQGSLLPGQKPSDRPDICARVFNMKRESLLDDLVNKQMLGKVIAFSSMKEDQKRGLPHHHTLLIMAEQDKPRTPEQIDKIVWAELPDANRNPKLHGIISKHMIHGPCGNINDQCVCMEIGNDGIKRCSKEFPKEFEDRTRVLDNGHPKYRRRDPENGGQTCELMVRGKPFTVDNRWVVPYNPLLSLRYQAHINVEVVTSVQCIKYIYKYTCKGSDRVIVTLADGRQKDITHDEVQRFQNARYISASEAYWRLYEFKISRRYPQVEKLPLHLEDEQIVYFQAEDAREIANKPAPETKLTAYFKLNRETTESHAILYPDMYQHYTWNQKERKWIKRRHLRSKLLTDESAMADTIGRIPVINLSANQSEKYFLRMLLYHKAGAKSFTDLKTVNGIQEPTFQSACLRLGILDDENEIDKVLEEAASVRFGPQLREVFATLLIWVKPVDPKGFWEKHQRLLSEDILHRDGLDEPSESVLTEVLLELQEHLERNGFQLEAFDLPNPDRTLIKETLPREIREETNYDTDTLTKIVKENVPKFSHEQAAVYNRVVKSVEQNLGEIIALEAAGGTGKTFLITTILAKIRSEGKVALAMASSGIAATLLMNGRTIHSRCKVPIENLNEKSFCNISKRDATAELIRRCSFIVMDEITMAHKHVYEAVDRTFRDIRGDDRPFGGVTTAGSGDWRQILPVVKRGSRADVVDACLKSSELWEKVITMKLTKNMRLNKDGKDVEEFAEKLLAIGEGREPVHTDLGPYKIRLDDDLLLENESLEHLCEFVWEGLQQNYSKPEWLCSRAILCPTNEAAEEVNSHMINKFPGEAREYRSSDKLTNESAHHQFPAEFLNTIRTAALPPHLLTIKKNCPIMLLRNLDPIRGHCNGTRYVVNAMHDHIIDATIATGVHVGRQVFIPRIPMTPSDSTFPFQMIRRQFPVRVCFGLTSNKAQGQELEKIGIYLKRDFFSHGQLYVALSRAKDKDNVKILTKNGHYSGKDGIYTDNIVFREVLS